MNKETHNPSPCTEKKNLSNFRKKTGEFCLFHPIPDLEMTLHNTLIVSIILLLWPHALNALPVPLGSITVGLESFDTYQEGMAYLSTDEDRNTLEILISYKGFGLDQVSWLFSNEDLGTLQKSSAQSAWWRSRLLEIDITQEVTRDMADINPKVTYKHRERVFPFESMEKTLRFVRQGRDYALLLTESAGGIDTRRNEDKTFPVFTLHFSGKELPIFRDIISENHIEQVFTAYTEQKTIIANILSGAPD